MITNTNKLDKHQLKKLLEYNNIYIVKDHGTYYTITCPNCKAPEAFIVYTGAMRWIKCNRENNCYSDNRPAYNKKLWSFLANSQGIDENDSSAIVQYVNETLGMPDLELAPTELKESVSVELTQEDLKFLQNCNEIFKQAILEDNEAAKFVRDYLQEDRGYSLELISKFEIGLLPSAKELIALSVENHGYSEEQAKYHIEKLLGVTKYNDNSDDEFAKNNITIAWKDIQGFILGYSLRKPTGKKVANKYMSSNGLQKAKLLFNLHNYKSTRGKKLVIVEGQFDALAATHLADKEVQEKYHFIASGGKLVSIEQAVLLQQQGITEVILLIDNDAAGENYITSVNNLAQHGINISVARLPENSEFKDIDELLKNNPQANNFIEILEKAKPETINLKANNHNVSGNNNDPEYQDYIQRQQKIKEEIKKRGLVDLHNLKRAVDYEKKKLLYQELLQASSYKESVNKIKEYNDLLNTNYEEDEPYNFDKFYTDLDKSYGVLKIGFDDIDQDISIQPGTIGFIAGRPGHGKTTSLICIMRNMIKENTDKTFLYYSYEECETDILTKIILSNTRTKDKAVQNFQGGVKEPYFTQAKEYLRYVKNENLETDDKIQKLNLIMSKLEVQDWIQQGRLNIMSSKPSVETLSSAIIERVCKLENRVISDDGKIQILGMPVAAIFIDYVQQLNTEDKEGNREQEIQKICQTMQNTSIDDRVRSAIIMGSQVNREATSVDNLELSKMRESGAIENIANWVIGVWDETAAEYSELNEWLTDVKSKIKKLKLGYKFSKKEEDITYFKNIKIEIMKNLETLKARVKKKLQFKILKNRNGPANEIYDYTNYSERFCVINEIYDEQAEKAEKKVNKKVVQEAAQIALEDDMTD